MVGEMNDRRCATKDGRAKVRFDSRADAKAARRRVTERADIDPGKPYRCPRCGFFHLGHYPADQRTRRRFKKQHHQEAE